MGSHFVFLLSCLKNQKVYRDEAVELMITVSGIFHSCYCMAGLCCLSYDFLSVSFFLKLKKVNKFLSFVAINFEN